jgi:hypothetical protein
MSRLDAQNIIGSNKAVLLECVEASLWSQVTEPPFVFELPPYFDRWNRDVLEGKIGQIN